MTLFAKGLNSLMVSLAILPSFLLYFENKAHLGRIQKKLNTLYNVVYGGFGFN